MAIFWDGNPTPDDMTDFVRDVPVDPSLQFLAEFPPEFSDDNTIDFSEIVRHNRAAKFRAWDGRVHVSTRDTGSQRRIKLPPLSSSLGQGEYETLMLAFKRMGGTNDNVLAKAAYNDAEQLTREIQARFNLAWGRLISGKGVLPIPELAATLDYGVPAEHKVVAPVNWADTDNALVLTNIEAWAAAWRSSNGGGAIEIKTSSAKLSQARRNKEVIDACYGATQGRTRVSLSELNQLLGDEGLPTFGATDDSSVEVDGVDTRVFDADKVAIMPVDRRELGSSVWGTTTTAVEMADNTDSDLTFEDAPGIVGVIDKGTEVPYRQMTFVDACGLPKINGRKLLVATV